MTVVSDKHSYNFELRTATPADCDHGRVVYDPALPLCARRAGAIRRTGQPGRPNAFLPLPEKRNTAYTYSGAVELVPMRIFDDGTSTYIALGQRRFDSGRLRAQFRRHRSPGQLRGARRLFRRRTGARGPS
ncbi:MAG: TrbG/VirB9 family P-type conjugative transfer protein [Asticcacaulis sp.]